MANRRNGLLPHLRRIVQAHDLADAPDAELLDRFHTTRDEQAFAALVRRHGPMVLAVGRRLLASPFDVDDAFQATFLVLVRKAGSIRRPEQLGNWLFGVAYRTALKARTRSARQRAKEQPLIDVPAPEAVAEVVWRELRPILDAELHRLPDRLRVPVVLCYLQGRTKRQAALQLGVPEGTVSSRLHQARTRLRRRLGHRGLELSAGALAMVLTHGTAAAALPPGLTATTAEAASVFAAGASSALSVSVVTLAQGVLGVMTMTKLKMITAVLIAVGVIGAGAGGLIYRSQAAEPGGVGPGVAAGPPSTLGERQAPQDKRPASGKEDLLDRARLLQQVEEDRRVEQLQQKLEELRLRQAELDALRQELERAVREAAALRKLGDTDRQAKALAGIERELNELKQATTGDKAKQPAVADFEKAFQKLKNDIQGKGAAPKEDPRKRAEGILKQLLEERDTQIEAEALKRLLDQRIEREQLLKQLGDQGRVLEAEALRKLIEQQLNPKPQPEVNALPPSEIVTVVDTVSEDGDLVQITAGSDNGVERGQTFEVYRIKPQQAYLGSLRIIEVRARDSVGQITKRTDAGRIQAGDQAHRLRKQD